MAAGFLAAAAGFFLGEALGLAVVFLAAAAGFFLGDALGLAALAGAFLAVEAFFLGEAVLALGLAAGFFAVAIRWLLKLAPYNSLPQSLVPGRRSG